MENTKFKLDMIRDICSKPDLLATNLLSSYKTLRLSKITFVDTDDSDLLKLKLLISIRDGETKMDLEFYNELFELLLMMPRMNDFIFSRFSPLKNVVTKEYEKRKKLQG